MGIVFYSLSQQALAALQKEKKNPNISRKSSQIGQYLVKEKKKKQKKKNKFMHASLQGFMLPTARR